MFTSAQTEINVLVIDDDDVAIESVERSLTKCKIKFNIVAAADGIEGLQILRRQHAEKTIAPPMLVLLDLNMPRMDGFEFLAAVREDEALHKIVIFVLTTSSRDCDLCAAYQKNIAGYMVKSVVGPQFGRLTEFLTSYCRSVNLPVN